MTALVPAAVFLTGIVATNRVELSSRHKIFQPVRSESKHDGTVHIPGRSSKDLPTDAAAQKYKTGSGGDLSAFRETVVVRQ